ncbi:hypothetical protein XAC217_840015 [Xanthomonas citri pv. citri]|nr:hypothetical protein XAC1083_770016 [Xanthomonas citri pv. citri]CEE86643.1 hypothetical protein XACLC80_960020 [Xanthomonas citri pv. citri]CEF47311.1 hypothetical protein XAC217_840015 [Xanthomonas citri pv. citri]
MGACQLTFFWEQQPGGSSYTHVQSTREQNKLQDIQTTRAGFDRRQALLWPAQPPGNITL